ncbi:hypothetical protein ACFS27_17315 [Promicromonospora vindobonensis]|uniref:Alpha/beta hydrolase n=1 Tax=Promicromonospora vindobonensis TaxID=195748 RepID=A0ABW5VWK2_9MICO
MDRPRYPAGGARAAHRCGRPLRRGFRTGAQREEARQVSIPLLLLLQWDDDGNPRQRALDLFDAFGTEEKTLHANLGGHLGTPWFEREDGDRFFGRHLR